MRKSILAVLAVLLVSVMVLTACGPKAGAGVKVGQVTDTGGIDDRSFNATAWKGVQDAVTKLGIEGKYLESQQQTDYERNIKEFMDQGYALIVTVGFLLGDATKAAAEANPNQSFAIVDSSYTPEIANVLGLTFATDEAAFLAGYLAAGMSKTGKVGTFGGIPIPPVTIFMVGFEKGVLYYNQQKGTNVQVLGWKTDPAAEGCGTGLFTGNFESTDDGRRFGTQLMDEGADIVVPVAGPVGLGTAAAVQERGMMMIGVDTDWYVSADAYKAIYLTSILKNMDVAVYDAIKAVVDKTFKGGTYVGTLKNNGVGLAAFHDFDSKVPAALKSEIEQLKKDIIAGKVATGWADCFK
jgi:basic membrane protein A